MLRVLSRTPSLCALGTRFVSSAVGNCFDKNLIGSQYMVTSLLVDQKRNYWTKEGRIGWRRMRAKERRDRERILEPATPLIDAKYPWPKDDFETLPPDLFKEDMEEFTPEEELEAKNDVVRRINQQLKDKAEGRLFAVVHISGKQFKVTPEDIIIVQETFPPTVGDIIRLNKILLVGGKDFTLVGSPLLQQEFIRIEATVIEKTLSYTKLNFKMQKRKNYRRLRFFKTNYTMLRINMIDIQTPLDMIKSDNQSFQDSYRSLPL